MLWASILPSSSLVKRVRSHEPELRYIGLLGRSVLRAECVMWRAPSHFQKWTSLFPSTSSSSDIACEACSSQIWCALFNYFGRGCIYLDECTRLMPAKSITRAAYLSYKSFGRHASQRGATFPVYGDSCKTMTLLPDVTRGPPIRRERTVMYPDASQQPNRTDNCPHAAMFQFTGCRH